MKAVLSLIAATVVCAVVTVGYVMIRIEDNNMQNGASASLAVKGKMPSLDHATAWLNSEKLTDADVRGKVVLVEFWTYSCINWRRQLPYVRAWAEKYKDKGLVVVGVHTPEFGFEKDIVNVSLATKEAHIEYPIAVDNEYSIWGTFENRYWPALYFVDAGGNIRHHQFGEGNYDKSERIIQQLLREAGSSDVDTGLVSIDARGAEAAAKWEDLGSPEIYLGYARTVNFSSEGGIETNNAREYFFPRKLELNHWALSGTWTIGNEATRLSTARGGVRHRFRARDVHLVMAPASKNNPITFRLLIDGQPPGSAHGVDVDGQGNGTIIEPRMYQLIRQTTPILDRTLEIEFLDPGVEIYSITFG